MHLKPRDVIVDDTFDPLNVAEVFANTPPLQCSRFDHTFRELARGVSLSTTRWAIEHYLLLIVQCECGFYRLTALCTSGWVPNRSKVRFVVVTTRLVPPRQSLLQFLPDRIEPLILSGVAVAGVEFAECFEYQLLVSIRGNPFEVLRIEKVADNMPHGVTVVFTAFCKFGELPRVVIE